MTLYRPLLLVSFLVSRLGSPAAGQQPPDALRDSLARGRLVARASACGLEGPGGQRILEAMRTAQFTLIGESHGVADVPRLVGGLFCAGAESGYRYLAIETGEATARELERRVRTGPALESITAFTLENYPGAPFYVLREEAELLATVVEASSASSEVLWGIDYDVMIDRFPMTRLAAHATTREKHRVLDSVLAIADSMLATALAQGNPGAVFAFAALPSIAQRLRAVLNPPQESEGDRILRTMEATIRINNHWVAGQLDESNRSRAENLRQNFLARYRALPVRQGRHRVMVKLGANHAVRGPNFTGTLDIGSLLPELAASQGATSLGILLLAGPGTEVASFNPRNFSYTPVPETDSGSDWAGPFLAAADSGQWSVFDVRPWRGPAGRGVFGPLPRHLLAVLYGFDFVVVLGGSGASTPLVLEPPVPLVGRRP